MFVYSFTLSLIDSTRVLVWRVVGFVYFTAAYFFLLYGLPALVCPSGGHACDDLRSPRCIRDSSEAVTGMARRCLTADGPPYLIIVLCLAASICRDSNGPYMYRLWLAVPMPEEYAALNPPFLIHVPGRHNIFLRICSSGQ